MSKPEWKLIAPGVWWCKGCGRIKIVRDGGAPYRYLTPRRERDRRRDERVADRIMGEQVGFE